jgi:hypothetical protein
MYCVAFWFTRRDDSFRGFVGNPNDMNPGSITQRAVETNTLVGIAWLIY